MKHNETIWQRMRAKWRIAVINEETLAELLHMRLSLLNLILVFIAVILLTLMLFGMLIWYTPLRNYLPGNTQGLREELVRQNVLVDSLQDAMNYQDEYLGVIRQVIAGEVEADSVAPFDSLYITHREELLSGSSPVVEEFMEDYEQKAGDNLTLFSEAVQADPVQTLLRPAPGVLIRAFSENQPVVLLQVPAKGTAVATLAGTVVSLQYVVQEGWTCVLQHDGGYLSVYGALEKPLVRVGSVLRASEAVGLPGERPLQFSLWRQGKPVNPETVIAF